MNSSLLIASGCSLLLFVNCRHVKCKIDAAFYVFQFVNACDTIKFS
jgi:hypothetical protein